MHTVPARPDRVFLESDARCAKSSPKNYNQYLFADAPRVAESLTRAVRDVRRSVDDERVALAFARASQVDLDRSHLPMKRRRLEAPAGACLAERALKRNGMVYKNFGRFRAGACAGPPLADGFAGDAALAGRSSL